MIGPGRGMTDPAMRAAAAPRNSILAFCACLLAIMWGSIIHQLEFDRSLALRNRDAENSNLARAIEEHVRRTLAAAGMALREFEAEYRNRGPSPEMSRYLSDRRDELEPYTFISVIDPSGNIAMTSMPLATQRNFSDKENSLFHAQNPTTDMFISRPRIGIVSGRLTIYLSRRINNADGSYGGYAVLGLDPGYIARLYDQIDLGPDSELKLIGLDGVIRAGRSNTATQADGVGRDVSRAQAYGNGLLTTSRGSATWIGPFDGVRRQYTWRTVKGYPLIVLVGTSEAATLAGYEDHRRLYLWFGVATTLVILAFIALVLTQMRRAGRITEALRKSEERYALVERGTHDGIWDLQLKSGAAYLSARAREILGRPGDAPALDRAAFLETVHPDDVAEVNAILEGTIRAGSSFRFECRLRQIDGGFRWVQARGNVVRDNGGAAVRMVVSLSDSTSHRQAVMALEHSERRLRQLFDDMLEGCTLISTDYRFIYVNEAAARGGHRRREDLVGRAIVDAYPGAEQSELFAAYRRVMEQRRAERLDVTYAFEDGAIGVFDVSIQPVPEGIFVLSLDITERVQSQRHVREQSRLLDLIFRHSLDGLVLLDRDFTFLRVNEAYAASCQRNVEDFPGRNHFELFPSALQQELEPYRSGKRIYNRAARPFVFPDHPEWGTTYWDLGLVPILDPAGEVDLFLFTLRDVTARVRSEEAGRKYVQQLKELSRRVLAAQEEERRAVARELHDEIGQGLTAIKIHLQAMAFAGKGCAPAAPTDHLHEALLATARILEQVRTLSLNLRPLQLDDLGLAMALRSLVTRAAATAGWDAHFDENLPPDRLDPGLELACYRVVQEALTNVMRHARATEVSVSVRHDAHGLKVAIRDNGLGFDVGGPHSTTEALHVGLLGMEERVRHLGGHFDIQSGPVSGTVITAHFPLAATEPGIAA